MSTQLQLRRGTTAQHSTFTGASGEITIDTDKKTVVVHDGTTAGGRALPQFDASGNLGIGVTPSGWNSAFAAQEFKAKGNAVFANTGSNINVTGGAYYDASTWRYGNSSAAVSYYTQNAGVHSWGTAPSGTAGNAITFTQAMTLDSYGNLCLNTPGATTSVDGVAQKLNILVGDKSGMYFTHELSTPEQYVVIGSQFSSTNNGYTTQIRLGCENLSSVKSFIAFATQNNSGVAERMRLDSSGNLLVGRTSILGFGSTGVQVEPSGQLVFFRPQSSNIQTFYNFTNQTLVGTISIGTTTTSYNTSSDYRLKEDYQPVADAIERLNQLKPINFAWKVDGSRCDGFLAHELQEVIPEAATGHKDEMRTEEYEVTPAIKDEEGNVITEAVMGEREVPVYQGIDQSKIVPLLTAALQEAVAKIESQAQTIESLTQRIEALEYTKQGE